MAPRLHAIAFFPDGSLIKLSESVNENALYLSSLSSVEGRGVLD